MGNGHDRNLCHGAWYGYREKYIQLTFDDPDGGPGPYSIDIIEDPHFGTLNGEGNDLYYSPYTDFRGKDSFSWKVSDGLNYSKISNVKIHVK